MERARLIGEQEQHAGSRVLDEWDEEAEDRGARSGPRRRSPRAPKGRRW